jgi:hypothetical protein
MISFRFSRPDIDNHNKQKLRDSITQDVLRAFNKLNTTTTITDEPEIAKIETNKTMDVEISTRDNDTSCYGSHDDPSLSNNRLSSKVTFESLIAENSVPSSPKTKDQSVMAQIDLKGRCNNTTPTIIQEQIQDNNENKNGRMPIISEGTVTSGSTSAKSSIKELVRNQKSVNHRKSKSQNRARKALRTITFILGRIFKKEE